MSSSDDDSEVEVPQNRGGNQELDFDSNEIRTIVNDTVQYVITASQKKLPIKKASESTLFIKVLIVAIESMSSL